MPTTPAPPAPSPAEGPNPKRRILDALSLGATLSHATRYAGISRRALARLRRRDPQFARDIRQRMAHTHLIHLQKLLKDPGWRSSAFLLERLWPDQYAPQRRAVFDPRDDAPVRIQIRRVQLPERPTPPKE